VARKNLSGRRSSGEPSGSVPIEWVVAMVIVASVVFLAIGYETGIGDSNGNMPADELPLESPHPGNGIDDPTPPSRKIVDEISFILNNTNSTRYEHHPSLGANISRSGGIYNTDCSGYVDYVLNLAVPTWHGAIE
jgi:hypothetical protein